jgi:hypothetical protein
MIRNLISFHFFSQTGPALGGASFKRPTPVTVDEANTIVFVAQYAIENEGEHILRKIEDGQVTGILTKQGRGRPYGKILGYMIYHILTYGIHQWFD